MFRLLRFVWRCAVYLTWRARLFWMAIILPTIVVVAIVSATYSEPAIRVSGLGLQIFGFLLAAAMIDSKRRLFGYPTLIQAFQAYWRGWPRLRGKTVFAAGNLSLGAFMGSARFRVTAGKDATLKKRVEVLEREHEALHTEVGKIASEHRTLKKELGDEMAAERQERKREDESIRKQIREAVGSGIHVEWVGVVFFLLGVTLSTASQEIASLLKSWC